MRSAIVEHYNFDGAERLFKRSIEIDQNHLLAHISLRINYSRQGKFDDAEG